MIVDSISNIVNYDTLNIKVNEIVEFIKKVEELNVEDGKYEILGEDLFALVQTYETKDASECRFETHKKYIDVQYVRQGKEVMNYKLKDQLVVTEDLSEQSDVIFYEDATDYTSVLVEEGSFALFSTQDGHMPGVKYNNKETVKKIVFKIKIV